MFENFPTLKGSQDAIDDCNARAREAAKDASDALSRLAKPASMVSGRMICPASVNGAPDCKLAAGKLCKTKGFQRLAAASLPSGAPLTERKSASLKTIHANIS